MFLFSGGNKNMEFTRQCGSGFYLQAGEWLNTIVAMATATIDVAGLKSMFVFMDMSCLLP